MGNIIFVAVAILGVLACSCRSSKKQSDLERFKSELFAVEKESCAKAQTDGAQKAFVCFVADSGAVMRNEQIFKGKEAIFKLYSSFPKGSKLEWAPDFADVSASGDLGYTYGKYTYSSVDSLGRTSQSKRIFHTVWKRQADEKCRFVWD